MTQSKTPQPPYVAVIFSSQQSDVDPEGYAQTAEAMVALAEKQEGYLGMESARGEDGFGITVSYWRDEACVRKWKQIADHKTAQQAGRTKWYKKYKTRITTVTRAYEFES